MTVEPNAAQKEIDRVAITGQAREMLQEMVLPITYTIRVDNSFSGRITEPITINAEQLSAIREILGQE